MLFSDDLRPVLRFWTNAYKAGTRITVVPQGFTFTRALNYWQRIEKFGALGVFPESEPVEPPAWVYAGLEDHEDGLRVLLGQEFPDPYARFCAHLLLYEHELQYIEIHARRAGHHIGAVGVDGGYFLMYHGKCAPSQSVATQRPLPPILSHIRQLTL